jgi:hypothetical protein
VSSFTYRNIIILMETIKDPYKRLLDHHPAPLVRSGSAWLGRSQKDGLPSCRGGSHSAVQGHRLALGGSLVAAPF